MSAKPPCFYNCVVNSCDVIIAGAGIIGVSLGLELREHGAKVLVLDPESPEMKLLLPPPACWLQPILRHRLHCACSHGKAHACFLNMCASWKPSQE